MTEKFTPGPWTEKHIRTDTHGIAWKNIRGGDGYLFAEVCGEANAHLIAAAPEMYEALKTASIALDMVRGSTFCETCDDNEICETCGIYKALLQTDAVLKKARGEE